MTGFPYVTCFTDRHGRVRYRYRRKGAPTVYLPGKPGEAEFAEAYRAAAGGEAKIVVGAGRTKPGSINALAVAIYASAEWKMLKPLTQSTYRNVMERLRRDYGDQLVTGIKQGHILIMRDKRVETPTAANRLVTTLRWMMAFAVARQMRADNPAIGIKPLKITGDGYHTWSEAEVVKFETFWAVGTRQRLAFDLLLYTAQRSGDVRQMGRQCLADGHIRLRQGKTDVDLEIPLHARLEASLATVPSTQMLFLQTAYGEAFSAAGFGNWFKSACKDAGLDHCSAHGLRKSAATRLADAGCSESQIMAITGHKTAREVQRYTAKRDQRRLAAAAMASISETDGEHEMANLTDRLAK